MNLVDANQTLRSEALRIARNHLAIASERRDQPAWHATLLCMAADRRRYAALLGGQKRKESA